MNTCRLGVLIATYLCLNSSMNLINKWALGHWGLKFPLLLTSVHMAFSFVVLAPLALRTPMDAHRKTLAKQWRGLALIGCSMALNIALNNLSLLDISLSLNQVIRSSIPVVTAALAVLVESRWPTRREAAALVTLSAGVALAVAQDLAGKPLAIAFCALGTLCNGAMMTFSGRVMSEKLDVVRLAFYTAPVALSCLFPFFYARERDAFLAFYAANPDGVRWVLLVSSANAVLYNMTHSLLIKSTSAVTVTVLGNIKIVGLQVLAAVMLGEGRELTPKAALGCALALAGFVAYSQTKVSAMRKARAAEEAPLLVKVVEAR